MHRTYNGQNNFGKEHWEELYYLILKLTINLE